MKKNVAIIAPTGMLGSMVYNVLKDKYDLVLVYRDKDKQKKLNDAYGGISKHKKIQFDFKNVYKDFLVGFGDKSISPSLLGLVRKIGQVSAVINCAGLTKPNSLKDPATTLFINGALPHLLANVYREKLIQITTDCVFDGVSGAPYNENSPHNPNDLYGLSKDLGEPGDRGLVLRTSIIGPEIDGFYLLIEWFKKQNGKTIRGFSNHLWNGVTTKEFAKICDRIISKRKSFPKNGIFHVFSTVVSKYEMLLAFRDKYKVDCKIIRDPKPRLNRTLSTTYPINKKLKILPFHKMLKEL